MKCLSYEPLFLTGAIAQGENFDDFVLKLKDAQFDDLGIAIQPEHVRVLVEALEARKGSEENEEDLDEKVDELTDDLEEARSELAAAREELEELRDTLEAVRVEADAEAKNAYARETECIDLRAEVEELKAKLADALRTVKKLSDA